MKHRLYVDSVRKSIDNKTILSDVYFECDSHDIIGLLGRNGSGKSTLLKIIFGSLKADNKFIKIDGELRNKGYFLNNEISYLPQHHFLPESFSVKNVIESFLDKAVLEEFYADIFIEKIKSLKINKMSGGELRYLEVKLILFSNSKFALLDEPFSGLAPIVIEKVKTLIVDCSKIKGIIVSDHNYWEIIDIVNKLYFLDNGRLHFLNDINDLIKFGYLRTGML